MTTSSKNNNDDKVPSSKQGRGEWLTVFAQPFFYGAITRLPFIYFVIHMRFSFNMGWNEIGLFVASYQAMRVVTSMLSMVAPKLAHAVGTLVGLAGNVLVILSDNDNQTNIILGTILVGSSETLAAMQTYVKAQFSGPGDLDTLEYKLKLQYAAVMLGVTFAFSIGGFVYQVFGINGVAMFGAILSVSELVSFLGYLIVERAGKVQEKEQQESTTHLDDSSFALSSEHDTDAETAIDVRDNSSNDTNQTNIITEALDNFAASGMGANYLNYALCFTFGMEAVTIGYNLAVSPVYITEVFHQNTTVMGILLAAGAGFGTATTIVIALTKRGHDLLEKFLPSPWHFLFAMVGITVFVLVAAVPIFPVHVVGLLFLMGFNDLAALLLNELQGAITSTKAYSTIGPMGQVVRRCGNVLTAATGPILFGILPQLPYIVAGLITAAWTILLAIIIRHRSRASEKIVLQNGSVPESVSTYYSNATFSRKEIITRQVKKGRIMAATEKEADKEGQVGEEFEC